MVNIKAQLTGAEYAKLRTGKIPAGVKRATRAAITKILRGVVKDAKAAARKRTGLLGKSIGSVVRTYSNETTVGVAGPRRGFKVTLNLSPHRGKLKLTGKTQKGKIIKLRRTLNARTGQRIDPVMYARLVEGGHKKGRGKSAAKAYPFLKPAADKANRIAKTEIVAQINAAISQTT